MFSVLFCHMLYYSSILLCFSKPPVFSLKDICSFFSVSTDHFSLSDFLFSFLFCPFSKPNRAPSHTDKGSKVWYFMLKILLLIRITSWLEAKTTHLASSCQYGEGLVHDTEFSGNFSHIPKWLKPLVSWSSFKILQWGAFLFIPLLIPKRFWGPLFSMSLMNPGRYHPLWGLMHCHLIWATLKCCTLGFVNNSHLLWNCSVLKCIYFTEKRTELIPSSYLGNNQTKAVFCLW